MIVHQTVRDCRHSSRSHSVLNHLLSYIYFCDAGFHCKQDAYAVLMCLTLKSHCTLYFLASLSIENNDLCNAHFARGFISFHFGFFSFSFWFVLQIFFHFTFFCLFSFACSLRSFVRDMQCSTYQHLSIEICRSTGFQRANN